MQLIRVILGYVAACVVASFALMVAIIKLTGDSGSIIGLVLQLSRRATDILLFAGLMGAIMLIPTLFFIAVFWKRQGPDLLACLVFGGVSGILIVVLLTLGNGDIGAMMGLALSCGIVGLISGLVFWMVAMWRWSPELPGSAQ